MKKIIGFILVLIFSISFIGYKPFSIYADTLSNSNLYSYSVHNTLISSDNRENVNINGSSIPTIYNNYTVEIDGVLDDEYIGYATILVTYYMAFSISYDSSTHQYVYTSSDPSFYRTVSHTVFINGNSFQWFDSYGCRFRNDIGLNFVAQIQSISITFSNVVQKSVIDSIDDLTLILNDQLTELQNANIELQEMRDFLETISLSKQWNIPFESYFPVMYSMKYLDYSSNYEIYYFNYPIFTIKQNQDMFYFNFPQNEEITIIFALGANLHSGNYNSFIDTTPFSSVSFERLNRYFPDLNINLYKLKLVSSTNQDIHIKYINSQDRKFIPIYSNLSSYENLSTDFALVYGLSNQLLDDLHIIAQGTISSISSVSDLDSAASDMKDSFDDFSAFENQIDTGFNDQMQNIDFSNPLTNNSGILPAANFVITIFNGLINNNPISVLIIIVCILLIGKKIIGK